MLHHLGMAGVDLIHAHLEGIEWKEGTWNWACGALHGRGKLKGTCNHGDVKDIGLPESLHPTTNARRYMVAAGVAETATWDPCVELPSPAASRQLRDELLVGSSSVGGPWGSGPRWLRPSGPRGRGPPAGWAPLAGRQPGSTDYLDTETLIHGLSARRFLFMSGFFIVLLDRERSKVV